MLSVGINENFSDGDLFELVINRPRLNADQQKPSPILNSMSEEILRLSGFYQIHFGDWLVKPGGTIVSKEVDDVDSETDALIFAEIK
jgi:hypothetical protein